MAKRLSKEDKKFLITTAVSNRDFLLNVENIRLSMVVALTALIASILSIVLTLELLEPLVAGVISAIAIVLLWADWYRSNSKLVKRIYKIRGKYTRQLKELYPDFQDDDLSI